MQKNFSLLDKSETLSTTSLKDQAYDLIKDGILFHKLTPGEVYSQDAFCSEFGISRTPVREALLQLQHEGYVSFLRGKGIEVLPVTDKRAADIIEARYYIEPPACFLAAKRRTEEHLKKIDDVMQTMHDNVEKCDARIMYRLDRRFHGLILAAANNEWLDESLNRLRDEFLRVETFSAFDHLDQALDVLDEHQKVVDALRAGDPEAAAEAMKEHLRRTSDRTTKHLSSLICWD